MKVKAIKKGWFNGRLFQAGEVFTIQPRNYEGRKLTKAEATADIESQFSPEWMEKEKKTQAKVEAASKKIKLGA